MIRALIDVAFNNGIRKVIKKSYQKTIDVQFGVYTDPGYTGWLTINLKPSHGWKDWLVNLCAIKSSEGAHFGYWIEVLEYWDDFRGVIEGTPELAEAKRHGILISGRSKGGAEALLIGALLWRPNIPLLIGAIEPPRCVDNALARKLEAKIGRENIQWTRYKNDIVPALPPWFTFPGTMRQIGRRTLGLSIRDHKRSTTKEELIYEGCGW
jgi:hypothetical protein